MKIKIILEAGEKKIEKEKILDTEERKKVQTHLNKLYRVSKKELWGNKKEI